MTINLFWNKKVLHSSAHLNGIRFLKYSTLKSHCSATQRKDQSHPKWIYVQRRKDQGTSKWDLSNSCTTEKRSKYIFVTLIFSPFEISEFMWLRSFLRFKLAYFHLRRRIDFIGKLKSIKSYVGVQKISKFQNLLLRSFHRRTAVLF